MRLDNCEMHVNEFGCITIVDQSGKILIEIEPTGIRQDLFGSHTLQIEWSNKQAYVVPQKYMPNSIRAVYDEYAGRLACYPRPIDDKQYAAELHKVAARFNIPKIWFRDSYYRVPIDRQEEFKKLGASGDVDTITVNRFNKIIKGKV